MKKIICASAIICAAIMASLSFSACGGSSASGNETTSAVSDTNNSQSIVGSWATELYGDEYVYTFNTDGTGVYNAAGKIMNLTYKTEDGIYYETFEGSTSAVKRPYRVENNQFIVEDTYGEEIVYNKK